MAVDANFISAQVGAAGEDAALLYDVVATAELDAARTPPSTSDDDDADAIRRESGKSRSSRRYLPVRKATRR